MILHGSRHQIARSLTFALITFMTFASGIAAAQPRQRRFDVYSPPGDNPMGAVVRDAPYSGEGTTTVNTTLADGTHINRNVTARLFRDSAGRVRREQTIMGLAELNPAQESEQLVTIVDPVAGFVYVLNSRTHEARRVPFVSRSQVGPPPAPLPPPPPPPPPGQEPPPPSPPLPPVPPAEESLGTKQIEGVTATGRRSTLTIPVGQVGNDRAIAITDERWESPELKLLLLSQHHDPRTGDVQFRLTNLRRAEPSPDLFRVPADYTVIDMPIPPQQEPGPGPALPQAPPLQFEPR